MSEENTAETKQVGFGRRVMVGTKLKGEYKASPFVTALGAIDEVYRGDRQFSRIDGDTAMIVLADLGIALPSTGDQALRPDPRGWVVARLWTGRHRPDKLKAAEITDADRAQIVKLAGRARVTAQAAIDEIATAKEKIKTDSLAVKAEARAAKAQATKDAKAKATESKSAKGTKREARAA